MAYKRKGLRGSPEGGGGLADKKLASVNIAFVGAEGLAFLCGK